MDSGPKAPVLFVKVSIIFEKFILHYMQIHFLWSLQSICLSEHRNITLQLNDIQYYQAQLIGHYNYLNC